MLLTDLLAPTYLQMLRALRSWLEKAQEQTAEPEALLSARLAPDMYPLAAQIRFCCVQAQEAVWRLKGEPIPDAVEALAREGRSAGDNPGDFGDAKARIKETLLFLKDLEGDALDGGATRAIAIELPNGMVFDMTGEEYARDWALPQFNFHLITAYAILRTHGVQLGKADYVQHAFAYLRPDVTPQD